MDHDAYPKDQTAGIGDGIHQILALDCIMGHKT